MTAGVNLLPARFRQRMEERRQVGIVAAALAGLLVVLSLVSLSQGRRLSAARDEREAEQVRTQQLQARRAELAPFRQLADGVVQRERLVALAMGTEVSWAGVLANLSAAFPGDASLTSFNAESQLDPVAAPLLVEPGDEASPIGSASFGGYSLSAFAPGLAEALPLLDGVSGLSEVRLQAGTASEIGPAPVTSFEAVSFVDGAALTGRYREGLPPGEGVELPPLLAGGPLRPASPDGTAAGGPG